MDKKIDELALELEILEATIYMGGGCKKCKKKKGCEKIKKVNDYKADIESKTGVKVEIKYKSHMVLVAGYLGKDNNLIGFWLEVKTSKGLIGYIPTADGGYVCGDVPDEHKISYT